MDSHARTVRLRDGAETFEVTVVAAERPRCVCLFAAGRGGNPLRHLPLLQSLAGQGCTVAAPHFSMLASSVPTKEELDRRIRRAEACAGAGWVAALPVAGVGHSIGTVVLLALAGGKARTLAGDPVVSGSKSKFSRLALMAPPTDFFRQPDALVTVDVPVRIWAGGKDRITPVSQAEFLKEALRLRAPVELCVDEDAGHFSYMDVLPPHALDPHPDRRTFLASLARDVGRFLVAGQG